MSYKKGEFYGIIWRWDYNITNKRIINICSFCPKCDYQVIPYDVGPNVVFKCEDCGNEIGRFYMSYRDMENRVERSIHKVIRKGLYKN